MVGRPAAALGARRPKPAARRDLSVAGQRSVRDLPIRRSHGRCEFRQRRRTGTTAGSAHPISRVRSNSSLAPQSVSVGPSLAQSPSLVANCLSPTSRSVAAVLWFAWRPRPRNLPPRRTADRRRDAPCLRTRADRLARHGPTPSPTPLARWRAGLHRVAQHAPHPNRVGHPLSECLVGTSTRPSSAAESGSTRGLGQSRRP